MAWNTYTLHSRIKIYFDLNILEIIVNIVIITNVIDNKIDNNLKSDF